MSPIEQGWDALDRRVRQQLRAAVEKEWDNIPQARIDNLINSMRGSCVAVHEANGGHTRY